MSTTAKVRVLFVCLGNICRSPSAHGVFNSMLEQRGLTEWIEVDSCGTGNWHAGSAPDYRATGAAAQRGYDLSSLRARQVQLADFERFDYILAMDRTNLAELRVLRPSSYTGHLGLFLAYADGVEEEVPDPYYDDGFGHVLDLIEGACAGLLNEICDAHPAS